MKPIKVNGVVVHCSDCINHMVSIDDAPCKNCWKAICHTGDIKGGMNVERGDFISGEAWCKYKFERESKKEEIERLQRKVERANKNLHNRIVYDNIVLTVLSVTTIAVLAGWI